MKTHTYQNFQFPQTTEDLTIAGHLIPKGYVNATLMAKNWGKEIKHFNYYSGKKYIEALELDINQMVRSDNPTVQEMTKTLDELRKTVEGWTKVQISITEKSGANPKLRGVWFHPELAIELAGWLNVNFKIWANRVLRLVLEDKIDSADFYYAKQQLQKEYEQKLKTLDRAEAYFKGVGANQTKIIAELNNRVSDLQETINNQDRKILSLNQSLTDIRTNHKKKITEATEKIVELEKNLSEATEKIVELGNSLTKAEKQIKAHLQRIDTVETRAKADESFSNIDDPECKYDAFLIFLHTGIKDYNYFKSVLHDRYKFKKDYKIFNWKKDDIRCTGDGRYKYLVTAKTMHNLLLTFRSKKGVDSRALPEIYRKLVKEALVNNINSRELRSR